MKIVQVNNYGFVRGGSDRYCLDLIALLTQHGHQVSLLCSSDKRNIVDTPYAVKGVDITSPSVFDVPKFIYSLEAKHALERLIEKEQPDIAHLHIYYGQITSSILGVFARHKIPVVQTLHEYKLICPVFTMVREGKICETCAGGGYWRAFWYRCNRGSAARSLATAIESYCAWVLGARRSVAHFIAVSDFLRDKMIAHGLPKKDITTVHNFVRDDVYADNRGVGSYILYFGRVEYVKGLRTLLQAMGHVTGAELYVVGSGDAREALAQEAEGLGLRNVRFLGFKSGEELKALVAGSICVVAPSEWYETFGLVLLESFAQRRPVVASRIGGMTELVTDGVDGLLVEPGNVGQLAEALNWMTAHRDQAIAMGVAGQEKARASFSAAIHYEKIMGVYHDVLGR